MQPDGSYHIILDGRECIRGVYEYLKANPDEIEAALSEDDRKRLDDNFKSWTDVFRLHLPTFGVVGLIVVICIQSRRCGVLHETG